MSSLSDAPRRPPARRGPSPRRLLMFGLPALAVARLLRCPTTVEVNDMPYGRGYERRPGLRSLAADRVKRLAPFAKTCTSAPTSTLCWCALPFCTEGPKQWAALRPGRQADRCTEHDP